MKCAGESWEPYTGICATCLKPLTGPKAWFCNKRCRDAWVINHWWTNARQFALLRSHDRCRRCSGTDRLEVNHIVPRRGKPMTRSCIHHQSNLEVLCHDHHVEVTGHQRREALRGEGRVEVG